MLKKKIQIHQIVRSKRRSIALLVTHDATLIVRAPLRTSLDYIDRLVQQKQKWILKKLSEVMNRPQSKAKAFVVGEEFFYLGKPYQLRLAQDDLPKSSLLYLTDDFYLCEKALPKARNLFIKWYKAEAVRFIAERCRFYSCMTGYQPISIKITSAQKRWGSCSHRRIINFSWRLMMLPIEIIDYVVVHELVHLNELNHSYRFWGKVQRILPDYKERMAWLRKNSSLFTFY